MVFDRMPLNQRKYSSHFPQAHPPVLQACKQAFPGEYSQVPYFHPQGGSADDRSVARTSGNDKKLLKLLGRLRKKAGRVRDLDVEIAALHSLKIPQEPVRKSQLMRTLAEERGKREKKLVKALDKKTPSEMRKRLKRSAGSLTISKDIDPLAVAGKKVNDLRSTRAAVTEETLHRFRIAGKHARYVAEMAGKNPEAAQLVKQLKHMQDAIGDWHDWAQLAQKAEEAFWWRSGLRPGVCIAQCGPGQVSPGRKYS